MKKSVRNWRELFLTPIVEGGLLVLAAWAACEARSCWGITRSASVLIFYASLVVLTFPVLFLVRLFFNPKTGVHSYETSPWVFYGWRLHSFLCETNLSPFYLTALLPPIFRNCFYRLLGAKISLSAHSIQGRILDPYLVTVGPGARVGDNALIIPHAYAVGSSDLLILDKVVLEGGSFVGERSNLEPGVRVGEGSMVKAMSLVPIKTAIPPREVWGGSPAKKLAEVENSGLDSN